MSNFFIIPAANPVRLYDMQKGFSHVEYTPEWETNRAYYQKFAITDFIRLQLLIQDDYYLSIIFKLVDCAGNVMATDSGALLGAYGDYSCWNVYNETILNQPEGIYYMEVHITETPDPEDLTLTFQRVLRSEPIYIAEKHENTVLFKYSHDANNFNLKFVSISGETQTQNYFYFRVEGGVLSDGFKPSSKDEVYIDQVRNVVLLDSEPFNVYSFSFGPAYGMPNWMADKLNRILSCNMITINGKTFVKNDGAKLEPSRDNNYSLAGWKIDLVSNDEIDLYTSDDPGDYGDDYNYDYSI